MVILSFVLAQISYRLKYLDDTVNTKMNRPGTHNGCLQEVSLVTKHPLNHTDIAAGCSPTNPHILTEVRFCVGGLRGKCLSLGIRQRMNQKRESDMAKHPYINKPKQPDDNLPRRKGRDWETKMVATYARNVIYVLPFPAAQYHTLWTKQPRCGFLTSRRISFLQITNLKLL